MLRIALYGTLPSEWLQRNETTAVALLADAIRLGLRRAKIRLRKCLIEGICSERRQAGESDCCRKPQKLALVQQQLSLEIMPITVTYDMKTLCMVRDRLTTKRPFRST